MRTSRHSFFLALSLVAVIGCRCDPPPNSDGLTPDFVANPTVLSFDSCPTQDESGNPVPDVFPDSATFTLENIGRVSGQLSVSIRGNDADLFKVVEETLVEAIGGGETAEIKVQFTPVAAGEATAELVVDDGSDQTEPVVVSLLGSGSTLPAQPTIKISYQDKDTGEFTECLKSFNGSIDNCLVQWPDTYEDQESTLKMKVENLGCPTLKVTGIELLPFSAGQEVQFFIDNPSVPPSSTNPATLSLADGTEAMEVELRFAPRDDGSFDGQRYAYMKVLSNSVESPESLITLFGLAAEPSLYTTPTYCDFTDANDTCNGTKVPTTGGTTHSKAVFQVVNGGNTPITIESVAFRNAAQTRFAIGAANPQGKTIAAGASEALEILYTDAPVYVTELLDIKGTSSGMPTNTATVRLQGGVLPCLFTDPATQLDFSDTTGKAEKPVQICNAATNAQNNACGDLIINRIAVSQGSQFFKLKGTLSTSTITAGNCTTAMIEFTPPVTGGIQAGTLDIETNDPDYGAPSYYRLNLFSDKPVDEIPVAVLKGPGGELNTMSVTLSQLLTMPKYITLHAEDSYDPPNMGAVAEYKFDLVPPSGATGADIVDVTSRMSVKSQRVTTPQVDLVFDETHTGLYRVFLTVYDSASQASATTELKISVSK